MSCYLSSCCLLKHPASCPTMVITAPEQASGPKILCLDRCTVGFFLRNTHDNYAWAEASVKTFFLTLSPLLWILHILHILWPYGAAKCFMDKCISTNYMLKKNKHLVHVHQQNIRSMWWQLMWDASCTSRYCSWQVWGKSVKIWSVGCGFV